MTVDYSSLKGKKILITGSTGFVGGHLARRKRSFEEEVARSYKWYEQHGWLECSGDAN